MVADRTRRADAPQPDDWRGDVGLGVSAWLSGTDLDVPPEWAGPLPETPFIDPSLGDDASSSSPAGSSSPARSERGFGEARGRSSGSGRGRSRSGDAPRKEKKPRLTAEERVAAMDEFELEEYARSVLLEQLTGQARSRKELADKLAKKCVPEELAARLLDRFEEVGLIDDEAFARMWIASRQPGKGLAGRALAQELRRKGIDDEIVKESIAEIDPEDEHEAAQRLVARKMRSVARLDRQVATRRLAAMLARKGYGASLAFSVVREALDAYEADQ